MSPLARAQTALERLRRRGRPVKMSVVVAVHNPGPFIEPSARSLTRQSMPTSEYEVIFVDDGSTDETPAWLDRLARREPHVRVVHLPPSGWPGRPRNVGLDAARGQFVYFVDHDDMLGPETLARAYDYATANAADVFVGRVVGLGRGVASTLFDVDRPHCSVDDAPLMQSMTPHKAFRRDFLVDSNIRFPEGRRRLEDHLFVVEAYLRARSVAVLSSYPCYSFLRRPDRGNASYQTMDPVGYYGNLREAVERAIALTEPGERRRQVLRRWLAIEMLGRVGGREYLKQPEARRTLLEREIRTLAVDHFTDPELVEHLPPHLRLRHRLLLGGPSAGLERLAQWESGVELRAKATAARAEDGVLVLDLHAEVALPLPGPVLRDSSEGAVYAPVGVGATEPVGVVERADLSVLARHRQSGREIETCFHTVADDVMGFVNGHREVAAEHRFTPSAVVDGALPAMPLERGTWDLFVRLRGWGGPALTGRVSVTVPEWVDAATAGTTTYATVRGNLSLRVK